MPARVRGYIYSFYTFFAHAREPLLCQVSLSVPPGVGKFDFRGRGVWLSPALRRYLHAALVVSLPMAGRTQHNQIDPPQLVVLRQRKVWALPQFIDMVDGVAACHDRRAFVGAIPTPAALVFHDRPPGAPPLW